MDLLDRLHRRVLEAAAHEPGPARFTIAELYQKVIPYRAVRGDLGVMELAQYEHALLRLLTGERGYFEVTAPQALEEMQRELASPNPILGVYRDYAGVEVVVSGAHAPTGEAAAPAPSAPETQEAVEADPAPAPAPVPAQADAAVPGAAPGPEAAAGAAPLRCHRCHESLPELSELRFCPACGADQSLVPCAECGYTLQEGWKFCIRCGTARPGRRSAG